MALNLGSQVYSSRKRQTSTIVVQQVVTSPPQVAKHYCSSHAHFWTLLLQAYTFLCLRTPSACEASVSIASAAWETSRKEDVGMEYFIVRTSNQFVESGQSRTHYQVYNCSRSIFLFLFMYLWVGHEHRGEKMHGRVRVDVNHFVEAGSSRKALHTAPAKRISV